MSASDLVMPSSTISPQCFLSVSPVLESSSDVYYASHLTVVRRKRRDSNRLLWHKLTPYHQLALPLSCLGRSFCFFKFFFFFLILLALIFYEERGGKDCVLYVSSIVVVKNFLYLCAYAYIHTHTYIVRAQTFSDDRFKG